MPYIPQKNRDLFQPELEECLQNINNKGDLTFCVYFLAFKVAQRRGLSYTNLSTAISCLEDAAVELRRRHLNPYEDAKIRENGDIE